jgi:CheY-like chemotaxis protein
MRINRPVILLLENDDSDVFMFRRALGRLGYSGSIRPVAGVTSAIQYLENAAPYRDRDYNPKPDLIVCDLKLFASTGSELLQWIRTDDRFRDIPVVMLSGSSLPSDRQRAMSLGAKAFMVKTGDINEATERVQQIFTFLDLPKK